MLKRNKKKFLANHYYPGPANECILQTMDNRYEKA
jgi:hypothetical protein